MKQQIRYFYDGWFWYDENLSQLSKEEIKIMMEETQEGQYLLFGRKSFIYPLGEEYEYRTDIRNKIIEL